MNKRIYRKQLKKLIDENSEVQCTLSGMKKMAKECVYNFPHKGRYTGRGLGVAHYYKCIGAVPVYTQCPKFRRGRTWDEILLTGTASACCIWRILAEREARAQYLRWRKETQAMRWRTDREGLINNE